MTRKDVGPAGTAHDGRGLPCGSPSRRKFLVQSAAVAGGVLSSVALGDLFGPAVRAADADKKVLFAAYPDKKVGVLSALLPHQPVPFLYPREETPCVAFMVRLGERAGGGIGPGQDVVAFSSYCTHQGGLLSGTFNAEARVMGPCPMHLSAFDLTRHGIVTVGQATENLPQVVLEARGDDIHAIGVVGLIYGYAANV